MMVSGDGKREVEAVDDALALVVVCNERYSVDADAGADAGVIVSTRETGTRPKRSSGGAESGFGVLLPDFGGRFARLRSADGICGDVDIPSFSDSWLKLNLLNVGDVACHEYCNLSPLSVSRDGLRRMSIACVGIFVIDILPSLTHSLSLTMEASASSNVSYSSSFSIFTSSSFGRRSIRIISKNVAAL